jgi:hypothetical protein
VPEVSIVARQRLGGGNKAVDMNQRYESMNTTTSSPPPPLNMNHFGRVDHGSDTPDQQGGKRHHGLTPTDVQRDREKQRRKEEKLLAEEAEQQRRSTYLSYYFSHITFIFLL